MVSENWKYKKIDESNVWGLEIQKIYTLWIAYKAERTSWNSFET